ncbi:hypothetical protein IWW38_002080, partial [Coemansia aciculifera]
MAQDLSDAPTSEEHDKGDGVDGYIASLHLERSNTRATISPSALQRRKTLNKQAGDPAADQEELEREIRQVERLASLLGRRQTKFDRKRGRPTVNHDLDATLEGFFEVQDENERVADLLLSGTHSAAVYSLGLDDLGEGIDNPELKQANIRSAPATLIATQFESEYEQVVDPFDRIDEMHLAKSHSGSAEYLPLDSYNNEGTSVGASVPGAVPELTVDLAGESSTYIARGKAAILADKDFNADSPISDDGLLVGITRNNTWKRQSMMLIQERDMLGPALPHIPADLEEINESEPLNEAGVLNTATAADQPEHLPAAAVTPSLGAKDRDTTSLEDAFVTGIYPTDAPSTTVVTDYLDILDFIDARVHSDIGVPAQGDEDDGHISSDLMDNSDSSDIDLSDDGANSSSDDSDDQYLSKISQQRMLRVANVIQQPPADSPAAAAPDDIADNATGLTSSSTLRRNRRILTKGKSIRRGSLSQGSSRAQPVVSTQTAEVSLSVNIPENTMSDGGAVPLPRWSVVDVDRQASSPQRQSAPSVYPAAHSAITRARVAAPSTRPDSLFSAGRSNPPVVPVPAVVGPSSPGSPAQPPGLAKLAEAAHAAASAAQLAGTRTTRGLSVSAMGGARRKPLPPIPDRISRTLQAADASAAQEAIAGGKVPPPLPTKARPNVPQALGGDKLNSRASIAAALERPSSQALFGIGVGRATTHQALPEHMAPASMHRSATESRVGASPLGLQEWLQRTDILAPAMTSLAAAKPLPPSEPIPERMSMLVPQSQQQQQSFTPRPMTAARKKSMRARSRVVRK